MYLISQNLKLIKQMSNKASMKYIDLPLHFKMFQYPVSLELSKYVGKKAYQRGSLDSLEFFCILANKIYTRVVERENARILIDFILGEKEGFDKKSSDLILSVKKWEHGAISDENFAQAIEDFCLKTTGVRLPVVSFFLRMLLPHKFGTLDEHATNALKSIGFDGVKDIPREYSKVEYFKKYSGVDYLHYNALLTEIGKQYPIISEEGEKRPMNPSEVDMALYMFDKLEGKKERLIKVKGLGKQEKIDRIMEIIEEILDGAITVSNIEEVIKAGWSGKIRGSAQKLEREMRKLAQRGDLTGMFEFYSNALRSFSGKRIYAWLEKYNKKSLESEYEKMKKIYSNPNV